MKNPIIAGLLAAALSACGATPTPSALTSSGPPGAPEPSDPSQELVDLKGCRWWVVVKPSGMRWEKVPGFRADCDGKELEAVNLAPKIEVAPETDATAGAAPPAAIEEVADTPKPVERINETVVTIGELERDLPQEVAQPATEPKADVNAASDELAYETSADGRGLFIQAASFRSASNARSTAADLENRGFRVLPINENGSVRPLIIGPFVSKQARLAALSDLRKSGFPDAYLLLR